jgi:hypothetical protein
VLQGFIENVRLEKVTEIPAKINEELTSLHLRTKKLEQHNQSQTDAMQHHLPPTN